ncbi:hypothetical protein SteCoe_16948 [Stentor coeruleus]|uniref:DegT/DnrJ/EryC1/StrS aminotransferase family protein n=1 Tax=Stentor coeruleus TaxID=5963 RepID=A0A1R2C046_9CILI|nr:hypothetical protein SteCoe_16948 [Stentor coeruleus]
MLRKVYPYACLNIDITWSQWFKALRKAIYTTENRAELSRKISGLFSNQDNVIVTVCIRTAFDLYLSALDLPKGSEVVITSINIPEMTRILRKHCLIPVPVDIHVDSMITPSDRLEKAITAKTKLIIIAMLYGVTYDLTDISNIAKKHNLPLFEDCSECYSGNNFRGSPLADVTVLSFGPIKTATAFGGGVVIVRDSKLLGKMQALHASYQVQPNSVYLIKVLRYSLGKIALNSTAFNYTARLLLLQLNIEYKKFVVKLMRGFPPSTGLEIYHFQPCAGLLSFLYWRLENVNENDLISSMKKVHVGTKILTDGGVLVPGYKSDRKMFWLYPVIVDDATKAYSKLNNAGIDAYRGISQLNKIDPPVGSSYTPIEETNKMFANLLYFPLHKDVPEKYIREICMKAVELLKPEPKL